VLPGARRQALRHRLRFAAELELPSEEVPRGLLGSVLLDVYLDDAHQAAAASAELRGARSADLRALRRAQGQRHSHRAVGERRHVRVKVDVGAVVRNGRVRQHEAPSREVSKPGFVADDHDFAVVDADVQRSALDIGDSPARRVVGLHCE